MDNRILDLRITILDFVIMRNWILKIDNRIYDFRMSDKWEKIKDEKGWCLIKYGALCESFVSFVVKKRRWKEEGWKNWQMIMDNVISDSRITILDLAILNYEVMIIEHWRLEIDKW